MAHASHDVGKLFAELRHRRVIRVALAYGIVGFSIIEAADLIAGTIDLPEQFVQFILVTILLGFPLAVVLAWAYDIVPDAAAREVRSQPSTDTDRPSLPQRWLSPLRIIVIAALALIGAFPNIQAVASTARHIDEGRIHRIVGRIDTAKDWAQSEEWRIADIVDRIGTGDAFAAGVLNGWLDASSRAGSILCGKRGADPVL